MTDNIVPSDWQFCQVFGDKTPFEEVTEVDIVSAVEYDSTGIYLAAGDKGGRIVLFEEDPEEEHKYRFFAEFQSHDPEFDYLKSLEIEEKINQIKWLERQNAAHFLLTTNDKTIKLWKVYEKEMKEVASLSHRSGANEGKLRASGGSGNSLQLRIPSLEVVETVVTAVPRKIYANAHAYHINSISLVSDHETFISADDLRVNLWNLDISDQSFNIVDIKPENMEELSEVITSTTCHPHQCNLFMYSSSKGCVKLADMRDAALCDKHSKMFEEEEDPGNKSFFSEIIASVSDAIFSNCGRYIIVRDYLTLRVWDIHNEAKPIKTINIHDYLKSKLCDLYENDHIFDKFECTISHDGNHLFAGSYNNYLFIYDWQALQDGVCGVEDLDNCGMISLKSRRHKNRNKTINPDSLDFNLKALQLSAHPEEPVLAAASCNNLFIFDVPSLDSDDKDDLRMESDDEDMGDDDDE